MAVLLGRGVRQQENPEFGDCNDISCNRPIRNHSSRTVIIFLVRSVDVATCDFVTIFLDITPDITIILVF